MHTPLSAIIALYLANGGKVIRLGPGTAQSRLRWLMQPHPTRQLPLGLGVVGRW